MYVSSRRRIKTVPPLKKLYFFLLFCLPSGASSAEFATDFEVNHVQPLLDGSPGGALVIVEQGQVALTKVYGVQAVGKPAPVTSDTLFRIASLSKTFAAAAAAKLVSETQLTWQSPVKSDLPKLKFKNPDIGQKINLKHVMSQSTGLMPHAYTNLIEERMSYQRILDRLDRVEFICQPGECYSYQNVVFSLVGDLVEAKTGETYDEFVNQRLFKPLQMSRASFGYKAFVGDGNHAKPHVWNGKKWVTVRSRPDYYKVLPAAGVNASIEDMQSWLLAQIGQRPEVLDDQALSEMHAGVVSTSRYQAHYPRRKGLGKVYYGLGWRVFDFGDQVGFVHHGGYVTGMCSAMVLHKPSGTGMVLLVNSEVRGLNELVLDFAELYNQHYPPEKLQLVRR